MIFQKQLDRLESEVFFNRPQRRQAFLMTDSKGRYLEAQVHRGEAIVDIVWKSGARVDNKELLSIISDKNYEFGSSCSVGVAWYVRVHRETWTKYLSERTKFSC